ncbi:MAG: methylated-DNA--[protein]-cysteine S-methyltransferase [Planctomycetota bacterium]
MSLFTTVLPSPVGRLRLFVDDDGALVRIDFPAADGGATLPDEDAVVDPTRCAAVITQLREYFAGERTVFALPLRPRGTEFQLAAWRALQQIPFGSTASYQQQARRIGRPKAVRAIGAANGRNPIPIVVPCHRVIGKDGTLTGFGGGLPAKRWLLDHERAVLERTGGALPWTTDR